MQLTKTQKQIVKMILMDIGLLIRISTKLIRETPNNERYKSLYPIMREMRLQIAGDIYRKYLKNYDKN